MNVSLLASDPKNALAELQRIRQMPVTCSVRSLEFARTWGENRERITPVLNETNNAIDTGLKRHAILQESIGAFAVRLKVLRAFATVFQNIPLQGTDKIEVAYYPLQTAASTDWNADNGYVFGQATNTQVREVTVNKRKYQPCDASSALIARQPFFDLVKLVSRNAQKLAVDVFTDVWSVVTAANYGAPGKTSSAASMMSDDVVDLKQIANAASWPDTGRSLIVNDVVDGALCKDPSYKLALNLGGTEAIRAGKLPNLSGFDYSWVPNMPTNGEKLIGVAAFMSAILAAFCPVDPTPEVRQQLSGYEVVTDVESGISMNYRSWGLAQTDRAYHVVECAYGYQKGVEAALKRICEP